MLNECPTLLRRKWKYWWLKEPALRVINQVILRGIACSRGSQPTCYRCNKVGHVAPKCRTRDVYCNICRTTTHVNYARYTKRAPRTTAATAGSAPRIHTTQETDQQADRASSRSEELWAVSQRTTGSAFATAAVSTSASGIHNFSPQIKV